MADDKNQNDQVQDLLARLRSQMSKLDEMFGLDAEASDSDGNTEPAVSDLPTEETCVEPTGDAEVEEAPSETFGEAEEVKAELVDDQTEITASDKEMTSSSTPDEPVQLDLFADIDAMLDVEEEKVDASAHIAEETANADTPEHTSVRNDLDDDTPVFSKTEPSVRIRKESIVAQALVTDAVATEDTVIVTEGEHPTTPPREKTETHVSLFVPNVPIAEEEPATVSPSPFSPDRRFDPSKYDAMLAAYEKRKAAAFEEPPTKDEKKTPSPLPSTPVLMPVLTPVIGQPSSCEKQEDIANNMVEEVFEEEKTEVPAEAPEEEIAEAPVEEDAEALAEASDGEIAESPMEASDEEFTESPMEASDEEFAESPMEASDEEIEEAPMEASEEVLSEIPEATARAEERPSMPPAHSRVVLAEADLSDTDRDLRAHVPSGRVHLAPTAYRAKEDKAQNKNRVSLDDDEEDFMEGLPRGIRESLVGSPLGRPNRAQGSTHPQKDEDRPQRKRTTYRFPEEIAGARDEDAASDYVRHHLRETLRQTRARLIVIAVLSFVLLLLENITLVQGFVPAGFVDVKTAGIIDALLLAGVAVAAWPALYVGAKGLFHGRVLPESILFFEVLAAFAYAVVFGALGAPTMYLSFVPSIGLAILYCFRVLHGETALRVFEKNHSAGEKLLLSPVAKKDMQKEMNALGKSLDGETPLVYRVRKTANVKGFMERCSTVCEDEGLNLGILLSDIAIGLSCFFIAFFANACDLATATRAALFGCFLSAPLLMLGVHVYCMYRTDRVAGEDSSIAGEATVREAASLEAIAFEDIEAAPSSGVMLSGIRVHCDDPTVVFKYLTALYGHIGGPLCGRFSGMYADKNVTVALVELVDATKDGISAAIDGAELVVGNGQYMVANGIKPTYDAEDEKALASGRSGVLYVAVNGMVCLKFFMEHRISTAFEKNALRLHRLGIATILRTYDPNFNDKTLSRSSALCDVHVHVVSKTVEQRNDFYAERAIGGIVTSGSSGKLLRLLLLCFRTRRLLRFGWISKLVACILGGGVAIALCVLGIFAFLPSVYIALYHLVLLVIYMAITAIGVKLPEIFEGK